MVGAADETGGVEGESCQNTGLEMDGFGVWAETTSKKQLAHRAAYTFMDLDLPARLTNTCGLKHCVNPGHWKEHATAMDES